jgi:site-specific recombinase XerD
VDEAGVVAWMAAHEWAPNTRVGQRAAIRGLHRWMLRRGMRPDDPTADLPTVRVPPAVPHPASEQALADARARAARDEVRLMIDLAACAGLRRTEIATLRFADLVEESGGPALRITGKGGRVRLVPIPDTLAERIGAQRSGWVFPGGTDAGHVCPDQVGRILSGVLGPGATGHHLRHRYATVTYRASRDLRAVQTLLGHSSPTTTAIYTEVALDDLRRAALAAS